MKKGEWGNVVLSEKSHYGCRVNVDCGRRDKKSQDKDSSKKNDHGDSSHSYILVVVPFSL